jgi:hypothetical protein
MEEQFFKYFREYIQNNKNKDYGLFEITNNAILYSMEKMGLKEENLGEKEINP